MVHAHVGKDYKVETGGLDNNTKFQDSMNGSEMRLAKENHE